LLLKIKMVSNGRFFTDKSTGTPPFRQFYNYFLIFWMKNVWHRPEKHFKPLIFRTGNPCNIQNGAKKQKSCFCCQMVNFQRIFIFLFVCSASPLSLIIKNSKWRRISRVCSCFLSSIEPIFGLIVILLLLII
jgi:hypothetical protein